MAKIPNSRRALVLDTTQAVTTYSLFPVKSVAKQTLPNLQLLNRISNPFPQFLRTFFTPSQPRSTATKTLVTDTVPFIYRDTTALVPRQNISCSCFLSLSVFLALDNFLAAPYLSDSEVKYTSLECRRPEQPSLRNPRRRPRMQHFPRINIVFASQYCLFPHLISFCIVFVLAQNHS